MNTSNLKTKQAQATNLTKQFDRSTLLRSILLEHYPSFNQEGTLKTSGICKFISYSKPHLPYKFWATNNVGQKQLFTFEQFKKLESVKFNEEDLKLIAKHWKV